MMLIGADRQREAWVMKSSGRRVSTWRQQNTAANTSVLRPEWGGEEHRPFWMLVQTVGAGGIIHSGTDAETLGCHLPRQHPRLATWSMLLEQGLDNGI